MKLCEAEAIKDDSRRESFATCAGSINQRGSTMAKATKKTGKKNLGKAKATTKYNRKGKK